MALLVTTPCATAICRPPAPTSGANDYMRRGGRSGPTAIGAGLPVGFGLLGSGHRWRPSPRCGLVSRTPRARTGLKHTAGRSPPPPAVQLMPPQGDGRPVPGWYADRCDVVVSPSTRASRHWFSLSLGVLASAASASQTRAPTPSTASEPFSRPSAPCRWSPGVAPCSYGLLDTGVASIVAGGPRLPARFSIRPGGRPVRPRGRLQRRSPAATATNSAARGGPVRTCCRHRPCDDQPRHPGILPRLAFWAPMCATA